MKSNTKHRLLALDGLRGLAGISVAISHSGYSFESLIPVSLIFNTLRVFSVGPNSVQMFFVLSGFLMAFLYPKIESTLHFYMARYGRIFPIFVTVVLYLWIVQMVKLNDNYLFQSGILLGLSLLVFVFWKYILRSGKSAVVATVFFFSMVSLQVVLTIISILIVPKLLSSGYFAIHPAYESVFFLLSNAALTTQFARGVGRLSFVFWSLPPEVFFYLLYPLMVVPILAITKRYPWYISVFIIFALTKVLFDLDETMRSLYAMSVINIARSAGFIVGVTIGTIYQRNTSVWKSISKYISRPGAGFLILVLIFVVQTGDWAVRDGQNIWFMNTYYLISSLVFGAAILAAIVPKTIVHKIFSNKVMVFFGLVSYSLYLTHSEVLKWAHALTDPIVHSPVASLFQFIFEIGLCLTVAYILFKLVESLYFETKKNAKVQPLKAPVQNNKGHSKALHISGFVLFGLLICYAYIGGFSPSFLVSHHPIPGSGVLKLQNNQSIKIPIEGAYNNMSLIKTSLWYYKNADVTSHKNKHPAQLHFRIYQIGELKPFFESTRSAYTIEGEPNYPFGFPAISDSEGKKYIVELFLENGSDEDHILVHSGGGRLVTVYVYDKSEVLKRPYVFISNKIRYILTREDSLFALGTIIFLLIAYIRVRSPDSAKS